MELKHLQALLGIADTGSFSAAAASIGTVQSNVSAHVARLERELDVQLVDRGLGPADRGGRGGDAARPPGDERARGDGGRCDGAARGGGRDGAPGHDRHHGAVAGAPALRPPPGAPPAHPSQRARRPERAARAAAGLGPARPRRGHLPVERGRDHGGPALRRGPGARPAPGPPTRHDVHAPPRALVRHWNCCSPPQVPHYGPRSTAPPCRPG